MPQAFPSIFDRYERCRWDGAVLIHFAACETAWRLCPVCDVAEREVAGSDGALRRELCMPPVLINITKRGD